MFLLLLARCHGRCPPQGAPLRAAPAAPQASCSAPRACARRGGRTRRSRGERPSRRRPLLQSTGSVPPTKRPERRPLHGRPRCRPGALPSDDAAFVFRSPHLIRQVPSTERPSRRPERSRQLLDSLRRNAHSESAHPHTRSHTASIPACIRAGSRETLLPMGTVGAPLVPPPGRHRPERAGLRRGGAGGDGPGSRGGLVRGGRGARGKNRICVVPLSMEARSGTC